MDNIFVLPFPGFLTLHLPYFIISTAYKIRKDLPTVPGKDDSKPCRFLTRLETNWFFVLAWLFLFYSFFSNVFHKFFDGDIYHMLSAGKAIANQGVIKEDVFFVNSGHKIVIQQWLYDLVVYEVYGNLGKAGILLFTILLSVLFMILAIRVMRYYEIDIRLAVTAVLLICTFLNTVFTIRPGLFTLILLLLQICICERHLKTGKSFYLYFLPLITILEINFHASMWIAHFIFLLPYLVPIPEAAKKYVKLEDHHISISKAILPTGFMIAGLFVNPYGIDGITILFKQSEIASLGISELRSPALSSKFAIVMVAFLVIFAFLYGKIKIHSSTAFLFLGTSLMLISNLRNIQMYSIGLIAIMCDLLAAAPLAKAEKLFRKTSKVLVVMCAILDVVLICTSAVKIPYARILRDHPSDNISTPVKAVEYLDSHASKDARIYTEFTGGSYVSWKGYKIYFCSRTEGYCKDVNGGYDLIGEYASIYLNTRTSCNDTFDRFLSEYDFDYLIVESRNRMYPYIASSEDYEPVVTGNGYVVFRPVE